MQNIATEAFNHDSSSNPLNLPEIISLIGNHLDRNSLTNALRVNKTWNVVLQHRFWYFVQLPSGWAMERLRTQPLSRTYLQNNCHFIRILLCPDDTLIDALLPNCCYLYELELSLISLKSTALVLQNAQSLRSLSRRPNVHQPETSAYRLNKLTAAMATLNQLRELRLGLFEVNLNEVEYFTTICQRLHLLHLSASIWDLPSSNPVVFSGIQELIFIKNKMLPLEEIEFVSRCPNLQRFHWQPTSSLSEDQQPHLQELFDPRLEYLHTLILFLAALVDLDIEALIKSLPALVSLDARNSNFADQSVQAIIQFRSGIRELDIRGCRRINSTMVQLLLSNCKDLETFEGDVFDIQDIVEGQPWVCTRIKKLSISIMNTGPVEARIQDHERMYSQLASLTDLSVLELGNVEYVPATTYDWMDLSLSHGLRRLETLQKLKKFTIGRVYGNVIGEAEREWFREHWPNFAQKT
ncbi:hypothetical protein BX616_000276 [Lobosporangium transversale]|uniref:F-box domain-containing protein n=1 Tax=Lobosporangium transversale TaxID=64571 RepID=A0A1Y2GWP5_9FUNG|nr:hypothetical protein BCR41DRAFT_393303 [Lobosporangium transversale]KAF9907963.1 hypothetical protein BX616_000276 [Lobosporangium transversale]ORZ26697.1 hypothetical protein BCR41DRAFT_393303 [Lobosporangium transversale]|eukprot:XP_021884460.1 hypothetical protein BCR41DRAFT_393303 [Lobosporangium transversale]